MLNYECLMVLRVLCGVRCPVTAIGDEGAARLGEALDACTQLQTLNLSGEFMRAV